ncbi:MAG: phosphodiester glycosidase family protein [Chloroflexota bacterium]
MFVSGAEPPPSPSFHRTQQAVLLNAKYLMKKSRRHIWLLAVILLSTMCIGGYAIYDNGRPAPIPLKKRLYEGVTYHRVVSYLPRPMIAHVLVIDTRTPGLQLFITPPEEGWKMAEHPLKARTTTQFLEDFGVQIAINGDGFTPWWSHGPLDYYPHEGDPVTPNGVAASQGKLYADGSQTEEVGIIPTLYVSRSNALSFNDPPNRVFQAISGDRMLVMQGEPVDDLDASELDPRTAIGINRNGRWLYIVVVDGRQPFYSDGATFARLADILIDFGAYTGMALDGGGSSTMVVEGEDGNPAVLNSPIDQYVPGRERPVANHLGIYLK